MIGSGHDFDHGAIDLLVNAEYRIWRPW